MLSVNETQSGFKVESWVGLLVKLLMMEKQGAGPAFCQDDGLMIPSSLINDKFIKQLQKVQGKYPNLLHPTVIIFGFQFDRIQHQQALRCENHSRKVLPKFLYNK